jgi:hypothetical protein
VVERVSLVRPVEPHVGNATGDRDQHTIGHGRSLARE